MIKPTAIPTIAAITWLSVSALIKMSIAISAPPKSRIPIVVQIITAQFAGVNIWITAPNTKKITQQIA